MINSNAARHGISILYQRAAIILEEMAIAHETCDIEEVRNQYARPQLLILDDFGLAACRTLAGRAANPPVRSIFPPLLGP
ncbi:ATP-binding protein [Pseudoxanthomonas spadix]|uniref:ATP-binding protein n=1 Tax=Pseudoxanthomonas spadix TaxID=415229 RepID=UPI000A0545D0